MHAGPVTDQTRPRLKVFVTRKLPAKVETRMAELFDVTLNPEDKKLDHDELLEAMRNFDVLVPTVTDRPTSRSSRPLMKISRFTALPRIATPSSTRMTAAGGV